MYSTAAHIWKLSNQNQQSGFQILPSPTSMKVSEFDSENDTSLSTVNNLIDILLDYFFLNVFYVSFQFQSK